MGLDVNRLEGWFYTVKPKYRSCTRKELFDFIGIYPRKLEYDDFMDHAAWYDFTAAPLWPYGLLIAIFNRMYGDSEYRICINADEVLSSRILNHWAVYDHGDWRRTVDGIIISEDEYKNEDGK